MLTAKDKHWRGFQAFLACEGTSRNNLNALICFIFPNPNGGLIWGILLINSSTYGNLSSRISRRVVPTCVVSRFHYCPVKLRPIWPEANRHAGFGLCQCVSDFNSKLKVASI